MFIVVIGDSGSLCFCEGGVFVRLFLLLFLLGGFVVVFCSLVG